MYCIKTLHILHLVPPTQTLSNTLVYSCYGVGIWFIDEVGPVWLFALGTLSNGQGNEAGTSEKGYKPRIVSFSKGELDIRSISAQKFSLY